jgi:hypothetical protein
MSARSFSWKIAGGWALGALLLKLLVLATAITLLNREGSQYNLCTWDCHYYRSIPETGYVDYVPGPHLNLAFFPVFPTLVGFFAALSGLSFGATAIGLNLVFYAVAMLLFQRWMVALGLRASLAGAVVLLFSMDRFVFWSHVPYTESLFVMLLLAFLVGLRSKNKRRRLMVFDALLLPLLAGVASGVRLVGIFLVGAWGLGEWRSFLKNPLKGVGVLVLGLAGVLAFFSYLHVTQGSWDLSMRATAAWDRHFSIAGIGASLWKVTAYFPTILVVISTAVFCIRPPRSLNVSGTERILFALLALVPMANSITISLTRYMSILLPAYPLLVHSIDRRTRRTKLVLWAVMAIVFAVELRWQVLLTMKFFRAEAFNWAG